VFAHVVAYFGIGYFDQMQFAWFALLAIICVAVSETVRPGPARPGELMQSRVRGTQEPLASAYQSE
jgi:hypothetical protein